MNPERTISDDSQDYLPIKEQQDKKDRIKVGLTRLNNISISCEFHKVKNGILFICVTQSAGT